jgi:phage-related holin
MKMKSTLALILSLTTTLTFICAYFGKLAMDNIEQYFALVALIFMDGFFGVIAGIKREGFRTYKAIKVLQRVFSWIVILTVILMIERGFAGTGWLSETIVVPFMVFELISALKNASMSGFIKNDQLNKILDLIDKHKGER